MTKVPSYQIDITHDVDFKDKKILNTDEINVSESGVGGANLKLSIALGLAVLTYGINAIPFIDLNSKKLVANILPAGMEAMATLPVPTGAEDGKFVRYVGGNFVYADPPGAGGGTITGGDNAGAGVALFKGVASAKVVIKSLVADNKGIVVASADADTVKIGLKGVTNSSGYVGMLKGFNASADNHLEELATKIDSVSTKHRTPKVGDGSSISFTADDANKVFFLDNATVNTVILPDASTCEKGDSFKVIVASASALTPATISISMLNGTNHLSVVSASYLEGNTYNTAYLPTNGLPSPTPLGTLGSVFNDTAVNITRKKYGLVASASTFNYGSSTGSVVGVRQRFDLASFTIYLKDKSNKDWLLTEVIYNQYMEPIT